MVPEKGAHGPKKTNQVIVDILFLGPLAGVSDVARDVLNSSIFIRKLPHCLNG